MNYISFGIMMQKVFKAKKRPSPLSLRSDWVWNLKGCYFTIEAMVDTLPRSGCEVVSAVSMLERVMPEDEVNGEVKVVPLATTSFLKLTREEAVRWINRQMIAAALRAH